MTEKKKVNVNINGRNFTVVGSEPEQYVKGIAAFVDEKIKNVVSNNDRLNDSMAAILAAFNIADEYYRTYVELEELKKEVKEPLEQYEKSSEGLNVANKKIEELEKECSIYKDELLESKRAHESTDKLIKKYEQALDLKEEELKENQRTIKEFQDKLFQSQIVLVETKKELEELKREFDSDKKVFDGEEG